MEQTNEMMQDPNRAAYMIAWRDRYIEKLEQIIEGRAQERQMLDCLLFYALFGMARSVEGERREVLIGRESLKELLGAWRCHTERVEDGYRVLFEAVGNGEDPDGQDQEE